MRWLSGRWSSPMAPARQRPGHIEIAQYHGAHAVRQPHPAHDVFHHQLAFAVGVGGPGGVALLDGTRRGSP